MVRPIGRTGSRVLRRGVGGGRGVLFDWMLFAAAIVSTRADRTRELRGHTASSLSFRSCSNCCL
jgi:hypothetical protein